MCSEIPFAQCAFTFPFCGYLLIHSKKHQDMEKKTYKSLRNFLTLDLKYLHYQKNECCATMESSQSFLRLVFICSSYDGWALQMYSRLFPQRSWIAEKSSLLDRSQIGMSPTQFRWKYGTTQGSCLSYSRFLISSSLFQLFCTTIITWTKNNLKLNCHSWSEIVFLFWAVAFRDQTGHNLWSDLNHMLCASVLVIEAEKLEV